MAARLAMRLLAGDGAKTAPCGVFLTAGTELAGVLGAEGVNTSPLGVSAVAWVVARGAGWATSTAGLATGLATGGTAPQPPGEGG